ncbi:MAG TPA: DUF2235 domain-containing protein [Longimicrobium sp.]|nr:DUF2235 domain-containing protein [Longimicrobium sp.]
MPRNLIICFDGTNNEFGLENTNVVRLVQVLDRNPDKQRLYYDPGVGTMPAPGIRTKIGETASRVGGLAFGGGLMRNVEEAYTFLMEMWEPGDKVFLFGFSRGAYTARVLAAMLHAVGLLPRANENMLPYAIRLFKGIRKEMNKQPNGKRTAPYKQLLQEFRWTFARPTPESPRSRRFHVHFEGVWDTVSSVGWVWNPASFPFTAWNPSIGIIRHAVSIDERRWFFRQNLVKPALKQDCKEMWFPGVHSDVGGGYPADKGGLWRVAFEWMLAEARAAGLLVDSARLRKVRNTPAPPARPWAEPINNSLTWYWWPAEYFPKLRWDEETQRRWPAIGRRQPRSIPKCVWLHSAALDRIRLTDANGNHVYSPRNLMPAFLQKVRSQPAVPPQGMQTDGNCAGGQPQGPVPGPGHAPAQPDGGDDAGA